MNRENPYAVREFVELGEFGEFVEFGENRLSPRLCGK